MDDFDKTIYNTRLGNFLTKTFNINSQETFFTIGSQNLTGRKFEGNIFQKTL